MKRIFIVGTPRSGTTLLQSIVLSSGVLLALPESHFYSNLSYHRYRSIALVRNLYASIKFLRWTWRSNLPISRLFVSSRQGSKIFKSYLDKTAESRGLVGWVEKTPSHLYHVSNIKRDIPDAKILVITRKAVDNVSSLSRASEQWSSQSITNRWELSLARWFNDQALIALMNGQPDVLVVEYDDILAKYDEVSRRIEVFLDLKSESLSDINDLEEVARLIVSDTEPWKENNFRKQENLKRDSSIPEVQKGYEIASDHFKRIFMDK